MIAMGNVASNNKIKLFSQVSTEYSNDSFQFATITPINSGQSNLNNYDTSYIRVKRNSIPLISQSSPCKNHRTQIIRDPALIKITRQI